MKAKHYDKTIRSHKLLNCVRKREPQNPKPKTHYGNPLTNMAPGAWSIVVAKKADASRTTPKSRIQSLKPEHHR